MLIITILLLMNTLTRTPIIIPTNTRTKDISMSMITSINAITMDEFSVVHHTAPQSLTATPAARTLKTSESADPWERTSPPLTM